MYENSIETVCIVGLGYVGLPLAIAFAEKKIKVIGIDKDSSKIDMLKRGKSYVEDISNRELKINQGYFYPTTDFSIL